MTKHRIQWSCLTLILVGLFSSFETAGAHAQPQQATGLGPPSSIGLPLISVVCSTPSNCVAIGTPIYGHTLGPIAVRTANGGAAWASTGSLSGVKTLYALACASSRTCVAVGTNTKGSNQRGAVVRTQNGGTAWSVVPALPKGVGDLTGISCPTKTFCMAVGSTSSSYEAVAMSSNDGGRRWDAVAVPKGENELTLVACTTRRDCIAEGEVESIVGDPSGGNRISIITTNNGGSSWKQRPIPIDSAAPPGFPSFTGLTCATPNHCLLLGDATPPDGSSLGVILSSSDSGASWTDQALPPDTTILNGISCGSATQCVAAGGGFGGRGGSTQDLLSTNNGGQTWTVRSVPPSAEGLDGVSCSSATSCLAVGFAYSSAAPTAQPAAVIVTHDGGVTWNATP